MPLNIVICCDGTNNQFSGYHTNVIRMFKIAVKNDSQVAFYDPGVGTMPVPWATSRLSKWWSMMEGLAFGVGFLDNIADAYCYLMEAYEPEARVYIFGFSRGAYTARALAGMLHSVGLLNHGSESLVSYALDYWQKDFGPETPGGRVCAEFKATLARPCPVHFVGVWDTVGSVGFINQFKTFPHTARNPSVTHVRHAISIDERRKCFRQNIMMPARPGQDVKNVWFAGVHCDVGGGYKPEESGLSQVAFAWMAREARTAGLLIDDAALQTELSAGSAPNPAGPVHVSLKSWWWLVELVPDRRYSFQDQKYHWHFFNFAQPRYFVGKGAPPRTRVHASVLQRMEKDTKYGSANLAKDAAALRLLCDVEE